MNYGMRSLVFWCFTYTPWLNETGQLGVSLALQSMPLCCADRNVGC
jgi:hypothetical protein